MKIKQLIEALDAYGDHVDVVVMVSGRNESERYYTDLIVSDHTDQETATFMVQIDAGEIFTELK